MSRLTLRLPESLHSELERRAKQEKVSLNQYLVYALTRHVAMTYMVTPMSEEALQQQREAFAALLEDLGQTSPVKYGEPWLSAKKSPLNQDWTPSWWSACASGSLMLRRKP
jgi:hypothetical protein